MHLSKCAVAVVGRYQEVWKLRVRTEILAVGMIDSLRI
jgi:hypothetical protein